jgi:hypothetical protein
MPYVSHNKGHGSQESLHRYVQDWDWVPQGFHLYNRMDWLGLTVPLTFPFGGIYWTSQPRQIRVFPFSPGKVPNADWSRSEVDKR